MIKKLRLKFILINMLLVGSVLVVALTIASSAYYSNLKSAVVKTMQTELEAYINPESVKPSVTSSQGKHGWDYTASLCIVLYNEADGQFTILSNNTNIKLESLNDFVMFAVTSKNPVGSIPKNNLLFSKIMGKGIVRIAFAETGHLNESQLQFTCFLLVSFAAFMVVLYFISLFLANTAIRPIEETLKKQKRFIADVSHELKTPLTVILANNKILQSHLSDSIESQLTWIDSTQEEAERMRLLVADMLTLAQNESGESVIRFSKMDLSRTVSRIFLQFEAIAFEKGLSISSDIEDHIHILGDEMKIKQLCMILLDNAIKYEPYGGTISILLHRKNGKVIMAVHNDGSVISQADIPHIFDRFYRCDTSRTSTGYGLGLSIARSITELHKGMLTVKSDEKSGTTFEAEFCARL